MYLQQVSQDMSDIANHDHWTVYLIMSLCIIVYLLYWLEPPGFDTLLLMTHIGTYILKSTIRMGLPVMF